MLDFVIDKIFVLFGRRVFNRLLVVQWYSITKRQAYNTIQKAKILSNTGPPKIGVNHGADDW
jgi:hypothetical protein